MLTKVVKYIEKSVPFTAPNVRDGKRGISDKIKDFKRASDINKDYLKLIPHFQNAFNLYPENLTNMGVFFDILKRIFDACHGKTFDEKQSHHIFHVYVEAHTLTGIGGGSSYSEYEELEKYLVKHTLDRFEGKGELEIKIYFESPEINIEDLYFDRKEILKLRYETRIPGAPEITSLGTHLSVPFLTISNLITEKDKTSSHYVINPKKAKLIKGSLYKGEGSLNSLQGALNKLTHIDLKNQIINKPEFKELLKHLQQEISKYKQPSLPEPN